MARVRIRLMGAPALGLPDVVAVPGAERAPRRVIIAGRGWRPTGRVDAMGVAWYRSAGTVAPNPVAAERGIWWRA